MCIDFDSKEPKSYVELYTYQVNRLPYRVLLVLGDKEEIIPVPKLAQEDSVEFRSFILDLTAKYHVFHIFDTDGKFVTLEDWTQQGL